MTYLDLKDKYQNFIYEKFEINEDENVLKITYFFEIVGLKKFAPYIELNKKDITNKNINNDLLNDLVFHIGLVELISYWKCAMPKNVIINAGYLSKEGIRFFKKLYYYGLGEFFYQNNIEISYEDFMNITCNKEKVNYDSSFEGKGNLIPIGGGKDSIVSMNLLKDEFELNDTFIINPKDVHLNCVKEGGYENKCICVKRVLDKSLIDLNNEGYLNGHTPFSALVSFITLLVSYLKCKKYIVLSNESSANESNIKGTKINHQYSKSYEYECDFNNYVKDTFNLDIHYFSMLRGLSEYQIAYLFSKYKNFHHIFKSCNKGSKQSPWVWCTECPKCLFVYIILSPFLSCDELISIFGKDLFEDKDLLETFIELTGNSIHKPFECVGTYEEVCYAISRSIDKYQDNLPFLLEFYKNNFDYIKENDILKRYNTENNLDKHFENIVRGALDE